MDLFTVRRLEKILDGYISLKVPRNVRSSVRLSYEWESNGLTLSEERPVAQEREWSRKAIVHFRLEEGNWTVYAKDGDDAWFPAHSIARDADFERQLEQVEIDREGLFWIS
jgi:hypothetical protein